jgi:hypothetical protein
MSTNQSPAIFLSDVRLSFPHLVEPQVQKNEKTGAERITYNCEVLMPPNHPGYAQFMQRFAELAQAQWKEHAQTVMQMIHQDPKSRCYGIGDQKINKKTFKPYDGYVGNVYITTSSKDRPQIIQADGTPIDPNNTMAYKELARKMYGGCRVNIALKPWPQVAKDNYGNGVRCDLVAIQFLRDDQPFGEAPIDASGMFGAVNAQAPAAPAGMFTQVAAPAGMPAGMPAMGAPQFAAPAAPQMPGLPTFFGN